MLRRFSLMSLSLLLVLLVTIVLGSNQQPPAARTSIQRFTPAAVVTVSESVNRDDIAAAVSKWDAARPALDTFWRGEFARRRLRYATPGVLYMMNDVVDTGCGRVEREGPFYCPADHTIYCDPYFVAGEMKRVGKRLRTDGDMAAIVILAHEWGHAVQRLMGVSNPNDAASELQADWLAGAFARFSARKGWLEKGDLEEAEMVLADGGDCVYSHGSPAQRIGSFISGYQSH